MKQRLFVDHIRIFARAGKGGDGSGHFHREKFNSKGGPDGGDGGRGGDVIFLVEDNTDNLTSFLYKSRLLAEHGANGASQQKTGKSGKPFIAKVPPGTRIYRADEAMTGKLSHPDRELELVADLTEKGEKFVLCGGGKGGRGNEHFKGPQNQVPDEHEPGEPGGEGFYYLELRKIADAGLVGFPNAGKSTLLGTLSAAKPKVANYPFTTLQPMVGVLEFPGFSRGTIADIPGLIEGAHANVGLGHDFLRHIMRCRILLFVVDTAGSEEREPIEDLQKLRKEIKLYDEELAKRDWIIIANKVDLPEAEEKLEFLRGRFPKQEIIPISAAEGTGIDALKARLAELIGHSPE
ncbi:MAG: GTP-binding protein [Verrucomicrobiales bacterium]|jgi:GTP-binding protein